MDTDRRTTDAVNHLLRRFRALPEDIPRDFGAGAAAGDRLVIPTVMIAAANSRPAVYRTAEFKCSGVDDHFEFLAAVAELAAANVQGRIVIAEGDYDIGAQITLEDQQMMVGMGWDSWLHGDTGAGTYVVATTCTGILRDFRVSNASGGGIFLDCICA